MDYAHTVWLTINNKYLDKENHYQVNFIFSIDEITKYNLTKIEVEQSTDFGYMKKTFTDVIQNTARHRITDFWRWIEIIFLNDEKELYVITN